MKPTAIRRDSRILLVTAVVALAGLLAWLQWRQWRATTVDLAAAHATLMRMRAAADTIGQLRAAPQAAASHTRSNEDLLSQIEAAIEDTGLDRGRWRDSIPQPAVHLPQTDYDVQSTRLYFDGLSLKHIATLTHRLIALDRTLRLSSIGLTSRAAQPETYDVDLTLSYLVYAPRTTVLAADEGLQ